MVLRRLFRSENPMRKINREINSLKRKLATLEKQKAALQKREWWETAVDDSVEREQKLLQRLLEMG